MELIEIKTNLHKLIKEHYEPIVELNGKVENFLTSLEQEEKEILALKEQAKQERASANTAVKSADDKMKKAVELEHSNTIEKKRLEKLISDNEALKHSLDKRSVALDDKEKVILSDRELLNTQQNDNKKQSEYLEMWERRLKFAQKELDMLKEDAKIKKALGEK